MRGDKDVSVEHAKSKITHKNNYPCIKYLVAEVMSVVAIIVQVSLMGCDPSGECGGGKET